MQFSQIMSLAEHGPDTFVGRGPRYPWGGLFGGQIVAQALRAAGSTVDPSFRVHSLHAYFIRPGDHEAPVRYEVDRLRDGRSFVTRSVVARQESTILHLSASFLRDRGDPHLQTTARPEVAGPETLADDSWGPVLERRSVEGGEGHSTAWMRVAGAADGPLTAACALAFLSDDLPADCVAAAQRAGSDGTEWYGTSLDHAIWFQQPVPSGGWLLFDYRPEGLQPPRGLSIGRVFDQRGAHLATVTQEVLVRRRRP